MSFFCLKKVYIKNICLKTPLLHTDGKITGCADTAPLFFGRERNRASGIPGRFLFMLPVVVILFSFLCGCGTRSPQPVLEPVNGTLAEEEEPSDKSPDNPEDAAGKEPASASNTGGQEKDDSRRTLTVHVCGAVKKEGVYSLPEGSRIRDAIEAAGGFDKDADTSFLNLAMKLEDSWQIRVPTVGEAEKLRQDGENGKTEGAVLSTADMDSPGITRGSVSGEDTLRTDAESGSSSAEVRRVNINTASVEELMEIPGIGESKAKKIIEYREKNGKFESIEDIMNVSGIKENSFRKMQEYITV